MASLGLPPSVFSRGSFWAPCVYTGPGGLGVSGPVLTSPLCPSGSISPEEEELASLSYPALSSSLIHPSSLSSL